MDTGGSDLQLLGRHRVSLAHPSAAYRPSGVSAVWNQRWVRPCASVEHCPSPASFAKTMVAVIPAASWGGCGLGGLRAHNFTFGIISSLSLEERMAADRILGLTFGNREGNDFALTLHHNGMLSDRIFTFGWSHWIPAIHSRATTTHSRLRRMPTMKTASGV